MNCISCGNDLSAGEVILKNADDERHYCMWCALGVMMHVVLLDNADVGHNARTILREWLDAYEKKYGGL